MDKKDNHKRRMYPVQSIMQTIQSRLSTASDVRNTYHNLEVRKFKSAPPALVAQSAGCQGIDPCEINLTEIKFDRVTHVTGQDSQLIKFQYQISRDVPYLSRTMVDCRQLPVEIQVPDGEGGTRRQFVIVKQCARVEDFRPGES